MRSSRREQRAPCRKARKGRKKPARRAGKNAAIPEFRQVLVLYLQGAFAMHLYTPFFVVPVIAAVFFSCILWATSSKEDGHSSH